MEGGGVRRAGYGPPKQKTKLEPVLVQGSGPNRPGSRTRTRTRPVPAGIPNPSGPVPIGVPGPVFGSPKSKRNGGPGRHRQLIRGITSTHQLLSPTPT